MWVNIGSGNGLLPDNTKSLPEPMLNYHQWCSVELTWRHQMETFSALLAICAGIHLSPVNSPHKGQWRGALMFSLIFAWMNGWVNTREAGDLRCYHAHYDVLVMEFRSISHQLPKISILKWITFLLKLQPYVWGTNDLRYWLDILLSLYWGFNAELSYLLSISNGDK